MDRQGKEVPNPLEAQKREAKYPTFSSKFGLKIEQTHTWDARDLKLLSPKALFHYALELRRRDIENSRQLQLPLKSVETAPNASTSSAPTQSVKGFWGKKAG